MRVLVVPEVYRPGDATACGTVNDAAAWVEEWLAIDDRLHVYWLMPPREEARYDAADVHADRERVTLVEARGHESAGPHAPGGGEDSALSAVEASMLTENGYTVEELTALREAVYGSGAYLDVVVDQRRAGRSLLCKWLLAQVDHWAASVRPFDVVADVHDLQVPEKYRHCAYRNAFQGDLALCGVALADGVWFNAGVDARRFRERGADVLSERLLAETMADAVEVGSPIAFDSFEERYADDPRWLHVAGSFWAKKNAERVFDVARRLHERFGVRTVLTSMDAVPPEYRRLGWVAAAGEADRETYRRALERGDLAVCASEYETVARTPFEQAASGQVLLLRDAPWLSDCVPDDHPLVADVDDLGDLAVAAVERWDEAVAANRRLVEHARAVRAPDVVGRRTYRDVRRRVDDKRRTSLPPGVVEAVERAVDEDRDGFTVAWVLDRLTSGVPNADGESIPATDVVYALRALGYRDRGNPGTPVFERSAARRPEPVPE